MGLKIPFTKYEIAKPSIEIVATNTRKVSTTVEIEIIEVHYSKVELRVKTFLNGIRTNADHEIATLSTGQSLTLTQDCGEYRCEEVDRHGN